MPWVSASWQPCARVLVQRPVEAFRDDLRGAVHRPAAALHQRRVQVGEPVPLRAQLLEEVHRLLLFIPVLELVQVDHREVDHPNIEGPPEDDVGDSLDPLAAWSGFSTPTR